MGMFDMFSSQTESTPTTDVTPVTPVTPGEEGKIGEGTPEGLDKWGNLVENKESKIVPPEVFDPVAILKDPEALENISNSLDFTNAISAETQQLLADNDPKGLQAMMNDVGKAAYLQAIQHATALNQQHVADIITQQKSVTRDDISSGITDYELEQALPEIKNPIIQLGIKSFIDKVKVQNPTMSGKGIAEEVRGYLKEMHTAVNPDTKSSSNDGKPKEIDWLSEMGIT